MTVTYVGNGIETYGSDRKDSLVETPARRRRCQHMPRYFFHISNGRPHEDELGEELPHDRAAWKEAMRRAREIEDVLAPGGTWRLEVRSGEDAVFRLEVKSE